MDAYKPAPVLQYSKRARTLCPIVDGSKRDVGIIGHPCASKHQDTKDHTKCQRIPFTGEMNNHPFMGPPLSSS